MKRFSSSDSLDALITIYQSKDKKSPKSKQLYSKDFQEMIDSLEEEDCKEEASQATEKKRRLTVNQVKALEKYFELDNKLEPERKVKLAEELGLQPRQVAVWFQNRRARLKSKELERDYGVLKANYDALKLDYNNLEQENEALTAKLRELKAKLCQENENEETSHAVEAEAPVTEQGNNQDICDNANAQLLISPASSSSLFTGSSSSSHPSMSMNWIQFSDSRTILGNAIQQQPQFVKVDEQNLFNPEGSCNFFSVDQAPTLQWYFTG